MQKLKKTRRKHTQTTEINRTTTEQLEEQTFKQTEIQDIQPRNLREQFVWFIRGGSWAGCTVCLCVVCCSLSCCDCFHDCLCCLICFRLLVLSFCIYNEQTRIKTETNTENNSKENINNNRTNRHLPARPLEIFIFRGGSWAGNPVFLFVLCFSLSVYVVVYVSLCLFGVRLVFLSVCIYNRNNT